MSFSGTLNSISLLDLFQLIGLARKSGMLTIITPRGRFSVAFREGRVVAASAYRVLPSEVRGPEAGFTTGGSARTTRTLVEANTKDLRLVASKIVKLRSGHFSFRPGVTEHETGPGVEVSSLLLDSCRQYDEEVRDGLISGESDLEESHPAHSSEWEESSPLLLYDLLKQMPNESSPGDISWAILQAARKVFRRAILFLVTEGELQGIGGFTDRAGTEPNRLQAALALIRIPRSVPSVLEDVVYAGTIGAGPAESEWWDRYFPEEMGQAPEGEYIAIPVAAGGETVMALYGDNFLSRFFEDNLKSLEILCRHAGLLLENQRLRQRASDARQSGSSSISLSLIKRGTRAS
jgi:GAF domain-containing protein